LRYGTAADALSAVLTGQALKKLPLVACLQIIVAFYSNDPSIHLVAVQGL
jgi:hypothetical protein